MSGLITTVHIATCVLIIVFILLQQSRNDGMGSTFGGGSGGGNSLIGSRSATNILTKITTTLAIVFMVTSLTLAHFSSSEAGKSLMETQEPASSMAPAAAPPLEESLDDQPVQAAPQETQDTDTNK